MTPVLRNYDVVAPVLQHIGFSTCYLVKQGPRWREVVTQVTSAYNDVLEPTERETA